MKTYSKDYQQPKINGGKQTIILDENETGETDQLDPKFSDQNESPSQRTHLPSTSAKPVISDSKNK